MLFSHRIDTSLGGFVYSDQYLQFATKLPENSELYGFGEHEHHSLRHEMNWQTMGMYSRDQPPTVTFIISLILKDQNPSLSSLPKCMIDKGLGF